MKWWIEVDRHEWKLSRIRCQQLIKSRMQRKNVLMDLKTWKVFLLEFYPCVVWTLKIVNQWPNVHHHHFCIFRLVRVVELPLRNGEKKNIKRGNEIIVNYAIFMHKNIFTKIILNELRVPVQKQEKGRKGSECKKSKLCAICYSKKNAFLDIFSSASHIAWTLEQALNYYND